MSQLRFDLVIFIAALSAAPALAEASNFGTFTLSPGFQEEVVEGHTGGSYPLSSLAKRDRGCLGFADPTPDHIMILQQNFVRLKLQVNSRGHDTTLLIQGPNNQIIGCGDDTDKNPDASVESSSWQAGTYRIWVGSFNSGAKHNYTLSVQE